MKTLGSIGLVIFLAFVVLAGYSYNAAQSQTGNNEVAMIDNSGEQVGTIKMNETSAGVLLRLDIEGLSPNGTHAFHVHEKGDCTPLESFKNAGGHFNPHGKHHGMMHPEGQHAGDMPNLKADKKGTIHAQLLNRHITLKSANADDERGYVYDEDGSSFVIHAKQDDHMSQPSGAAGDRIMCGVIR